MRGIWWWVRVGVLGVGGGCGVRRIKAMADLLCDQMGKLLTCSSLQQ